MICRKCRLFLLKEDFGACECDNESVCRACGVEISESEGFQLLCVECSKLNRDQICLDDLGYEQEKKGSDDLLSDDQDDRRLDSLIG